MDVFVLRFNVNAMWAKESVQKTLRAFLILFLTTNSCLRYLSQPHCCRRVVVVFSLFFFHSEGSESRTSEFGLVQIVGHRGKRASVLRVCIHRALKNKARFPSKRFGCPSSLNTRSESGIQRVGGPSRSSGAEPLKCRATLGRAYSGVPVSSVAWF